MKQVKFSNEAIIKLLEEKREVNKTLMERAEYAKNYNLETNTFNHKRNNIINKVRDLIKKMNLDLGEFEDIEKVELIDGEVVVTTFDVVEEFKNDYRKAKEDDNKMSDSEPKEETKEE